MREVERLFARIGVEKLLPAPSDRQYLNNRMQALESDLRARISAFRSRPQTAKSTSGFERWINNPDALPLLQQTVDELASCKAVETGTPPSQPGSHRRPFIGTDAVNSKVKQLMGAGARNLAAKLTEVFEVAANEPSGRKAVRLAQIVGLIDAAPPDQRADVAKDDAAMEGAAHFLAPQPHMLADEFELFNDFVAFAVKLKVDQAAGVNDPGRAAYAPAEVDRTAFAVLKGWLSPARDRGLTLQGRVITLKTNPYKAAESKYTGGVGTPGATAGFTEDSVCFIKYVPGKSQPSTLVHEAMHLYAHGAFRATIGDAIDEGVTEYFARKVIAKMPQPQTRTAYAAEYEVADMLAMVVGYEPLGEAYFLGKTAHLESRYVDGIARHGYTRRRGVDQYPSLLKALAAKDWASAKELLRIS